MLLLAMRRSCFAAALALGACSSRAEPDPSSSGVDPTEKITTATLPATAPACGNAGLPDCPLQRWMKSTLQTYQRSGDFERMKRSFSELAEHAPDGYSDWKKLSEHGAELAAKSDATAIKQVCKDCHQTHRARYRRELRSQPVW